ncbi:hepatic lectin-like [Saccostrea cucullata]|uniref:hepatic lectin-like n=1 Tax=Saccostrea cuccullata TaxID=36930 RepID=UPI002ED06353
MVYDLDTRLCFLRSKGISVGALTKPHLPTNIRAFTKDDITCSDIGYQESNWQKDRCFKAHYDIKTKPEADKECAKDNGFLVQIDSISKHNAVKQFIQSLPSGNKFFIDGSDEAIEDDWRLSDGNLLYLDWKPGEPNSCCKKYEHCVIIFRNGKYNDVSCIAEISFLCERSLRTFDPEILSVFWSGPLFIKFCIIFKF